VKYLQPRVSSLVGLCLLLVLMLRPASATDVAFIVADVGLSNAGDVVVNDILVERGFNVTLVSQDDDAETTLAAADAADLVIVSESVGSGNVNTEIKDSTSPVLLYEAYLYDDFQWMPGDSISNDFNPTDNGGNTLPDTTHSITIVEPAHPLAAGLPAGDVQVYTVNGRLAYGRLTAPASVVATVPGHPDTATIFAYEAGDRALDGTTIPARRVGFFSAGLTLTSNEFTEEGLALFNAALNYALGFTEVSPGDFNSDGVVDLADFTILVENFHTTGATFAQGDNNFSGTVDLADFLAFRKLFVANNPAAAAVPEPSAWLLAILGFIGLTRCGVRGRRSPPP